MRIVEQQSAGTLAEVVGSIQALRRPGLHRFSFPLTLEQRFEADTRAGRSRRLWREGLTAILVFNACLLLDYLWVRDFSWNELLMRTAVITPLTLAVNFTVSLNPHRWIREGSIAVAMLATCYINLTLQGGATAAHALFGAICAIITALFTGVVMRLRRPYTLAAIVAMFAGAVRALLAARGLTMQEALISISLVILAFFLIAIASQSLECEERLSYLLCLQGDLQAQQLAEANAELQRLSSLDKLTGLPNRRSLETTFAELWAECGEKQLPLGVVVIDIDHFKRINDRFGHMYGDEALRRLAELLPKALRSPRDMAARFGGEEFVLLLPHATAEVAMTVAERVRVLVEAAGTPMSGHQAQEASLWSTVSCGVSVCVPSAAGSREELLESADRALYAAKRGGRNQVKYASAGEHVPLPARGLEPHAEPLQFPSSASRMPVRVPAARLTESGIRRAIAVGS